MSPPLQYCRKAPVGGLSATKRCRFTFFAESNGLTDERQVTMQAYSNPVFFADVVRHAAGFIKPDPRITWFEIRAVNHDSIPNHPTFDVLCPR